MNKNVLEIIDALTAHQDTDSIRVLEELGTNSLIEVLANA